MGGRGATLSNPREQPYTATEKAAYGIENRAEISADERHALWEYTDSSVIINSRLAEAKGRAAELKGHVKQTVKDMDSAINRFGWNKKEMLGEDGALYRGAKLWALGIPTDAGLKGEALADYINENRLGTINLNYGYTSTSLSESVAKGFIHQHNGVIVEYNSVGRGVRGLYVSDENRPISAFKDYEQELLMQRNLVTVPLGAWVGSDGYVHVAADIRRRKKGE